MPTLPGPPAALLKLDPLQCHLPRMTPFKIKVCFEGVSLKEPKTQLPIQLQRAGAEKAGI